MEGSGMGGILRLTYPDVELGETLRCADIRPQAAIVFAADFAERDLRAQQRGERRNAAARDAGKQRGLVDADAAESQKNGKWNVGSGEWEVGSGKWINA